MKPTAQYFNQWVVKITTIWSAKALLSLHTWERKACKWEEIRLQAWNLIARHESLYNYKIKISYASREPTTGRPKNWKNEVTHKGIMSHDRDQIHIWAELMSNSRMIRQG